MKVELKNFIVPRQPRLARKVHEPSVSAIVPTYKPGAMALRLIEDLLAYNPKLFVVVVDDCTPEDHQESISILGRLRTLSPRVVVLRTEVNRLKAGALNLGLGYLLGNKGPRTPAVVVTLDDDVAIGPTTIARLAHELMANPMLGAVCSRCSVANKNKNLLTRLQGLEYVGFNAIRLADQGFVHGPLVMHGMLTAFRSRALRQAGPFAERHLIEDYEMTTRIKTCGWEVKAVLDAPAYTRVPERLRDLWRQRTRWSFGGVQVVLGARDWRAVVQDILGHAVFIASLSVIVLLLLWSGSGSVPRVVVQVIVALSLVQLAAWYAVQVWLMRWYPERDYWDWLLRLTILPELLYSNLMTLALLGSYAYALFMMTAGRLATVSGAGAKVAAAGHSAFRALGYSGEWGTRKS